MTYWLSSDRWPLHSSWQSGAAWHRLWSRASTSTNASPCCSRLPAKAMKSPGQHWVCLRIGYTPNSNGISSFPYGHLDIYIYVHYIYVYIIFIYNMYIIYVCKRNQMCIFKIYIYDIYIYIIYIQYIYTVYIYTVYIYIYSIYIYIQYIYIQYIIPKFRHRQQLNPPSRSSWHRLRPMFKGSRLRWDENFDRRKRGENHGRLPRSRRKHECSYECFIMWFIICLYYIYIYMCVCVS